MSTLKRLLGKFGAALFAAAMLAPGPMASGLEAAPPLPGREREILPGGCIIVPPKDGRPGGECPLEHTDVKAEVSGFIARVTLTQRFGNPFTEPIEAVYTFPMSDRAAVDTMLMKVGNRVIRGNIKEREEAQRIYQQARDAGKTASLLDQERPNIFTQSVANILPGNTIEITISYVEYLKYEDGEYEFSFPMVVGPRYVPGNVTAPNTDPRKAGPNATDQVPDAGRINPPITPEGTRAGHDISLSVKVDAGLPLQDIQSVLHEVDVQSNGNIAEVSLKNRSEIPNRDFVLKYKVAGQDIGDAVLSHAGAKGGFFTLVLQPPARVTPQQATPKEMIFVIDCSGSMSGFPIEKAKKTMKLCIEGMNPNDTFNLVTFAGGLGYCFDKVVPNTPANQTKALEYLANLEGGGGTEMMPAINAALGGPHDPERLRVVCMMTDGYIGNDMEILDAIQKNAKDTRVFSFGIGNGVNRFLIDGMAREGRGEAEVVSLESDGDAAAKRFHERIQSPVLTDISVDFGGLNVSEVFPDPAAIPDLFSAKPLVLTGRYSGSGNGAITVRGETAGGPFERTIDVNLPATEPDHDVLAPLWARKRIDWLMEQDWLGIQRGNANKDVKGDITKLGLEFGLVTQFTSFVAVEEKVVTEGGKPKTVEVPVEMPDGVSYEGIFGKEREQLAALGYAGVAFNGVASTAPAAPAPILRQRLESASRAMKAADAISGEARPAEAAAAPTPVMTEEAKAAASPKLDSKLVGLAGKLVNGNYSQGNVKVLNGVIKVNVYLSDMSDAAIKAVKDAGGKVVAERRSGKMLLVSIRVQDLAKLAEVEAVVRIEPSGS
ncbi:MAG: VWA domain-containing protein [Candidatus Hydrogenedentes bacterium]|nr:VWA domain-containing protein [Candidatus Hydrogenedentota bacterium]